MFVAQRELKYIPLGAEKAIIFHPGDEIPDFEKWDIHARRAHLNLEWVVEEVSGKSGASSTPSVFKVTTVNEGPAVPKEVEGHHCGTCERKFKSKRALSTHASSAHKK